MNKIIVQLAHKHGLTNHPKLREAFAAFGYDMYREGLQKGISICDTTTVVPGVSPAVTIRAAMEGEVQYLDRTVQHINQCIMERRALPSSGVAHNQHGIEHEKKDDLPPPGQSGCT